MLRNIFSRIFRARHYWRNVSFDEMAELYISRLITVFAINVVNLFAAVYLYKLGYSVLFILVFYGAIYALKIPFSILAAKITAYHGPKHGILYANLLRIPSLISFAAVPFVGQYAVWAVIIFGVLQQLSATVYNISYMVDFSKIKSRTHSGRELGVMQIVENVAKIISPLVGGLLASLFTPEITIIVAGAAFMVAAVPLMKTVEPTLTRQRLKFRGFPWRMALPALVADSVAGYDFIARTLVWPLFMTILVFAHIGKDIYAVLGGIASLGIMVAMLAAWFFGEVIDRQKGAVLLKAGVFAASVVHVFRPAVAGVTGVIGVSLVNEVSTSAYMLPFTRVLLDGADSSGFRVTYMMFAEMMINFGAALACFLAAALIFYIGLQPGMTIFFISAAIYQLLMLVTARTAH